MLPSASGFEELFGSNNGGNGGAGSGSSAASAASASSSASSSSSSGAGAGAGSGGSGPIVHHGSIIDYPIGIAQGFLGKFHG